MKTRQLTTREKLTVLGLYNAEAIGASNVRQLGMPKKLYILF